MQAPISMLFPWCFKSDRALQRLKLNNLRLDWRWFYPLCVLDKECRGNSVGIEDPDKVSGGGIVASSWLRSNLDFAPSQGRLHNEKGSWCANKQEEDPKPYLQVELPVRTGVCAVATQGSALYDTDYVTKYEIQTSLDKENWVTYQENGTDKIFHGNTNADHMLKVNLDQPVLAMFVRFVIKEFVEWPCMRVEVYGTPANCTVRTKDNECCVFPFMYKGERHFSCLSSLFNGDWCATTHDYDKDKKWGECLEGDLNAWSRMQAEITMQQQILLTFESR